MISCSRRLDTAAEPSAVYAARYPGPSDGPQDRASSMARDEKPPRVVNVEYLRRMAKRRLTRAVFDYVDGCADGEYTLKENRRAYQRIRFRPRGAVAVPECELRVSVLGVTLALPFLLAPVGS